jgi:hypothetical protein
VACQRPSCASWPTCWTGCADHLRLDRDADLLALTVGLDAWGRQVVQSYRTVPRAGLIGVDRGRLRHRLSLLGACGSHPRALAAVVTESGIASPQPATARAELGAQSRSVAGVGALPTPSQLAAAVANARERVTSGLPVRDMPPHSWSRPAAPSRRRPPRPAPVERAHRPSRT